MAGFRDVKVGGSSASKYILKFESDKDYIIKIVKDDVKQWQEIWPTFITDSGVDMRRFVLGDEASNAASLFEFKKHNDIKRMLNGDDQKINNWNAKSQFACLAIVGVEQKVKDEDGNIKRAIVWDKNVKIYAFGISSYRKLDSINHNPELTERAASKKLEMADPDDADSTGYNCTDVFALRIKKTKKGKKTEYDIQADKLVGIIKKDLMDYELVNKELDGFVKPSLESEIDAFISAHDTGSPSSEPASAEEELDDTPAQKPAAKAAPKAAAKPAAKAAPVEDIELGADEDETPAPKGKPAAKKADDDLEGLDDLEIDETA